VEEIITKRNTLIYFLFSGLIPADLSVVPLMRIPCLFMWELSPSPPSCQVSKCLMASEGVKSAHHYNLENNKYFPSEK